MSTLHLLLSGERNSQEFAETRPALDVMHCLTSALNPGFPGITYRVRATPLNVLRLLEEINRVKVLRHPR